MAGNSVDHSINNEEPNGQTDITFELDNGEQVACHRQVMARASPFLKAMFAHDDGPIYKMTTNQFELIHAWAYQSQLPDRIDMEHIKIADYLMAEELLEGCIEKYWDPATSRSDLTKLMEFVTSTDSLVSICVTSHMAKHFDRTFLWMAELSHRLLVRVVQLDYFTVSSEALMMKVIQGWAGNDDERQKQLPEIIRQIHVSDEATIAWHRGRGYVFTRNTNSWHQVPALDLPGKTRYRFAVTRIGSTLYIAGGFQTSHTVSAMDMENPQAGWQECAPMNIGRQDFSLVSIGGSLYALGGVSHTGDYLNSCKVYDPTSNEWREIASMSQGKSNMGVAISNSSIIVVGGRNSAWGRHIYSPLRSTELFDTTTNTWVQLPSMKNRFEPCCTVFQGKLLAMGRWLTWVECLKLDNANNGWSNWPSMKIPGRISSAYSVDNNLFVVRGNGRLDSFDGQNWHQGKDSEGWPRAHDKDVTTTTVKMTGQLRTLIAEVEKISRKSVEFCNESDTWKLNVAHVLLMQENKF